MMRSIEILSKMPQDASRCLKMSQGTKHGNFWGHGFSRGRGCGGFPREVWNFRTLPSTPANDPRLRAFVSGHVRMGAQARLSSSIAWDLLRFANIEWSLNAINWYQLLKFAGSVIVTYSDSSKSTCLRCLFRESKLFCNSEEADYGGSELLVDFPIRCHRATRGAFKTWSDGARVEACRGGSHNELFQSCHIVPRCAKLICTLISIHWSVLIDWFCIDFVAFCCYVPDSCTVLLASSWLVLDYTSHCSSLQRCAKMCTCKSIKSSSWHVFMDVHGICGIQQEAVEHLGDCRRQASRTEPTSPGAASNSSEDVRPITDIVTSQVRSSEKISKECSNLK